MVDAVRCAIEVQTGMRERNAGVSADKRIQFRIGDIVSDQRTRHPHRLASSGGVAGPSGSFQVIAT
jgi:hypothetical protein